MLVLINRIPFQLTALDLPDAASLLGNFRQFMLLLD